MTGDEIAKMDYKQLRNTVIELNDNYIKLKRMLDDTLNNLDASNLATTFRKELDGYKSEFKITAKEISSKVEHIEDDLEQYSTIKQTADKIEMAVNENREYTDGQTQELSSKFSMTAGQISTNVTKVNNKTEKYYSEMAQTADYIRTKVGAVLQRDEFEMSVMPTKKNTDEAQKEMICVYNGKKYYYNIIGEEWREFDGVVESALTQTADGFVLNGCVEVQGKINMRENAEIGRELILHDQDPSTTGSNRALVISVGQGLVTFDGLNRRTLRFNCGGNYFTLSSNKGLEYNGKRVLTTDDLSEGSDE
ncbi:MAG: hypothetical protein IJH36_12140 [Clostridia bacterium]|nr:hypothetical protein [Clostridia bacterium]